VRYVVAVGGLVLLIGVLAGIKFAQISSLMAMGKQMKALGPPPEAVGTARVQEQSWEELLYAVGSVTAVKGVTLTADLPGTVTKIAFESGDTVKAGQILVELETRVERAQLASAQARKDLAATTEERTRALVASGAISKAQLDADEAQLKSATKDVEALAATIERKTIHAPFDGRLGIRTVNLGQYLSSGTPVSNLESIEAVYVDFTLPQQRLHDVEAGTPIRAVANVEAGAPIEGKIDAIDPAVDPATRTFKVRATVLNKDRRLRPGMFVNVDVVLPHRGNVVTVPSTALVHASYGDSVFVVEDKQPGSPGMTTTQDGKPVKVVRQQFVRSGEARGDFVSLREGVKPSEEVVVSGAFKLRNGVPVVVNNAVLNHPELNPHPENR
jgi:membrane fusion protein (multidrug efflux system)